jgi:hypothetical protein
MPNRFVIRARKAALAKIHRSAEWKENKAKFKLAHPWCDWHLASGKKVPTQVPHHPEENVPLSVYPDLERCGCIPLCNQCHGAIRWHKVLCKCGRHYHHYTDYACTQCKDEKDPQRVTDRAHAKELKKITDKLKRDARKKKEKERLQPLLDAKKKKDKAFRQSLKKKKVK